MLERPGIKTAPKSTSTVMASLSLYLIILAFFIMMNTISQRQGSRTEGVLQSISGSFKKSVQTTIITLDIADQGAGQESAPGFETSIEELFESAFPLARVEASGMFDRIDVTLPLDSMFAPGGTVIQGRNEAVLDRLADILGYDAPGKIHEIEALLPWAPTAKKDGAIAANTDSEASNVDALLAVNRAGTLARELTARGVSAAAIAIGIERRLSGSLRLLFVTRTVEAADDQADDKP